jgi:hypothetical protein
MRLARPLPMPGSSHSRSGSSSITANTSSPKASINVLA